MKTSYSATIEELCEILNRQEQPDEEDLIANEEVEEFFVPPPSGWMFRDEDRDLVQNRRRAMNQDADRRLQQYRAPEIAENEEEEGEEGEKEDDSVPPPPRWMTKRDR